MKLRISTTIVSLLFIANNAITQTRIEKGWEHRADGDIPDAQFVAEKFLKNSPAIFKGAYSNQEITFVVIACVLYKT